MRFVLGSGSPSRKQVLQEIGLPFDVLTADINERAIRRADPRELVLAIAQAKMDAILPSVDGEALVITSDQVMLVDGYVREKPLTKEEAYQFLNTFDTTPQTALSGTMVMNTATGEKRSFTDEVHVTFDPIPRKNIVQFVESGEALHFAGALKSEHPLFAPYIHVEGERESLMGLPRKKTLEMIGQLLDACPCGGEKKVNECHGNNMDHRLSELVLEILLNTHLMSLGTVDAKGVWVADVIFTFDDDLNLYWMSMPERRHSRTIDSVNPRVALTITATQGPEDPDKGLQIAGTAQQVKDIPWESVERFFKKRLMPIPSKEEDYLDDHLWYKLTPDRIELIYGPEFGYTRQTIR